MERTADQIKEEYYSRRGEEDVDDGMGPDSPGGYYDQIIQTEDELEAPQTKVQEEPEEDWADMAIREQQRIEDERLARLDFRERSDELKRKREAQNRYFSEMHEAGVTDMEETGFELKEFPLVSQQIAGELRFGRKGFEMSEEDARTVESPGLAKAILWINANQEKVFRLLAQERHREPVHESFKKLIDKLSTPKIATRLRDKVYGYDQPERKQTDEQIDENLGTYFQKERR